MHWDIECPVYVDANGTTTYRQDGGGVEVIYQAFADDHPWKDRGEPKPKVLRRITPEQAVSEVMAIEQEIAAAHKAAAKAAASSDAYKAYCEALPENLAGFRRGHFGRSWEIMDMDGEYIMSVPKKAASEEWSVAKLETWIDEQVSMEGFGD